MYLKKLFDNISMHNADSVFHNCSLKNKTKQYKAIIGLNIPFFLEFVSDIRACFCDAHYIKTQNHNLIDMNNPKHTKKEMLLPHDQFRIHYKHFYFENSSLASHQNMMVIFIFAVLGHSYLLYL